MNIAILFYQQENENEGEEEERGKEVPRKDIQRALLSCSVDIASMLVEA